MTAANGLHCQTKIKCGVAIWLQAPQLLPDPPAENAFDRNTETFAQVSGGPELAFDFTGSGLRGTNVRVKFYPNSGNQLLVNGNVATGQFPEWYEYTFAEETNIGVITTSGTPSPNGVATIAAIQVDGKWLVDKVNDSQVWSDDASGLTNNGVTEDYVKVFDGDRSTGTKGSANGYVELNFSQPLTANDRTIEALMTWSNSSGSLLLFE